MEYSSDDPKLQKWILGMRGFIDSQKGDKEIKERLKNDFSIIVTSSYKKDGLLPTGYTICRNADNEITGFGISNGQI